MKMQKSKRDNQMNYGKDKNYKKIWVDQKQQYHNNKDYITIINKLSQQ